MNNFLKDVEQFQRTFGHPVLDEPTIINQKRFDFRISLIEEELKELKEAQLAGDKVGILDGFEDIQYVLSGMILETGFQKLFDAGFTEVHSSNMSKSCDTQDEAIATCYHILETQGWECTYTKIGDYYVVQRVSDGKTMKSKYYSKPNLKQFID